MTVGMEASVERVPEQHDLNQYIIQMHYEFGIELISTVIHYYNKTSGKTESYTSTWLVG